MLSDQEAFTCIRCSEVPSHISREMEPVGQTGRDVYSVASRVFFTHVFGEGRQLPRRPIVTYCPNIGAWGTCC